MVVYLFIFYQNVTPSKLPLVHFEIPTIVEISSIINIKYRIIFPAPEIPLIKVYTVLSNTVLCKRKGLNIALIYEWPQVLFTWNNISVSFADYIAHLNIKIPK